MNLSSFSYNKQTFDIFYLMQQGILQFNCMFVENLPPSFFFFFFFFNLPMLPLIDIYQFLC